MNTDRDCFANARNEDSEQMRLLHFIRNDGRTKVIKGSVATEAISIVKGEYQ